MYSISSAAALEFSGDSDGAARTLGFWLISR
jgi:hypothetical protein